MTKKSPKTNEKQCERIREIKLLKEMELVKTSLLKDIEYRKGKVCANCFYGEPSVMNKGGYVCLRVRDLLVQFDDVCNKYEKGKPND